MVGILSHVKPVTCRTGQFSATVAPVISLAENKFGAVIRHPRDFPD
jgi:hypothetical protein